jgi:hypothetical protein
MHELAASRSIARLPRVLYWPLTFGAVAQLGERCVRNAEVEGSTPFRSTCRPLAIVSWRFSLAPASRLTFSARLPTMDSRQTGRAQPSPARCRSARHMFCALVVPPHFVAHLEL